MNKGTVKWFNATKGYGFITPENGGQDVFVHISAVERAGLRELRDGQVVSFELVADRKTGKTSAGNLVVVCTPNGYAQPLAQAIDEAHHPDVAGTIAGENTVFVAARDGVTGAQLAEDLRHHLEGDT